MKTNIVKLVIFVLIAAVCFKTNTFATLKPIKSSPKSIEVKSSPETPKTDKVDVKSTSTVPVNKEEPAKEQTTSEQKDKTTEETPPKKEEPVKEKSEPEQKSTATQELPTVKKAKEKVIYPAKFYLARYIVSNNMMYLSSNPAGTAMFGRNFLMAGLDNVSLNDGEKVYNGKLSTKIGKNGFVSFSIFSFDTDLDIYLCYTIDDCELMTKKANFKESTFSFSGKAKKNLYFGADIKKSEGEIKGFLTREKDSYSDFGIIYTPEDNTSLAVIYGNIASLKYYRIEALSMLNKDRLLLHLDYLKIKESYYEAEKGINIEYKAMDKLFVSYGNYNSGIDYYTLGASTDIKNTFLKYKVYKYKEFLDDESRFQLMWMF